jgi:hypothetical protein
MYDNSQDQKLKEPSVGKPVSIVPYPSSKGDLASRLVCAALLTGIVDGLFSSILSVAAYHSTVSRLFQGVAAVLLGQEAFIGGTATVALGILMHFGVAFAWSGIFLLLALRWSWVRAILTSRYGVAKIALLYGPFIWIVMSLAVIPSLTHHAPTITIRWWIQLLGHIPFVGLPIVACSLGAISRTQAWGWSKRR